MQCPFLPYPMCIYIYTCVSLGRCLAPNRTVCVAQAKLERPRTAFLLCICGEWEAPDVLALGDESNSDDDDDDDDDDIFNEDIPLG